MESPYHIIIVRHNDSYIRFTTLGNLEESLAYFYGLTHDNKPVFPYIEHMIDLPDVIASDLKDFREDKSEGNKRLHGTNQPKGYDFVIIACKHIGQMRTHKQNFNTLKAAKGTLKRIKESMRQKRGEAL